MTDNPVKYVAELAHVREVSLLGTAKLAFWSERLTSEHLTVADHLGKARIMIIAAEARYKGIRFRELSFSVLASRDEGGIRQAGACLLHAFDSCRFFAFCERTFFSTPYWPGNVHVRSTPPASAQLIEDGEDAFRAGMGRNASGVTREPSLVGDGGWEGPVFLPEYATHRKLFFVRIKGRTQTFPFIPGEDSLTLRPSARSKVLQALIDSEFAGETWALRQDATHARSKTLRFNT